MLEGLREVAIQEKYYSNIEPIFNQLKTTIEQEKGKDLIKYQDEISQYLAVEIVARYYYQKGKIVNQLSIDPDIKVAKEILLDSSKYKSILSGK